MTKEELNNLQNRLRKAKLLIFDFDGTIADTKKMYYEATVKGIEEQGYKLKRKQLKKSFGMKLTDILKRLSINKNINEIKTSINREVFKDINKIKISKDVKYLKGLKEKYYVIIASNTFSYYIHKILRYNKINNFFREAYGGEDFYKKEDLLKRVIKNKKLKPKQVAYIGDMARDVEVARAVGCYSIIIKHKFSWDSGKRLRQAKPDLIIKSFKELRKVLL